jgi:putative membrane protein
MLELSQLPTLNASLNATSAALLITGYYCIRQQNITAHRLCMGSAFMVSVLFLCSYLYYHAHAGSTRFTGVGWIRPVYFTILLSHTVLAAMVPFLAIATLYRALKQDWDKHRRIARWTLPIWLYVSVTGVVIYWLLYHVYRPQQG